MFAHDAPETSSLSRRQISDVDALIQGCIDSELPASLLTRTARGKLLDVKGMRGHTALEHAVQGNDLALATRLLAAGATMTPKCLAIRMQLESRTPIEQFVFRALVTLDNDSLWTTTFNLEPAIRNKGPWGTLLHLMARHGRVDMLQALAASLENVDVKTPDRLQTPLHWAAENGQMECVEILFHLGARLNLPDSKGIVPFWTACNCGHLETARRLAQLGAELDGWDFTPGLKRTRDLRRWLTTPKQRPTREQSLHMRDDPRVVYLEVGAAQAEACVAAIAQIPLDVSAIIVAYVLAPFVLTGGLAP